MLRTGNRNGAVRNVSPMTENPPRCFGCRRSVTSSPRRAHPSQPCPTFLPPPTSGRQPALQQPCGCLQVNSSQPSAHAERALRIDGHLRHGMHPWRANPTIRAGKRTSCMPGQGWPVIRASGRASGLAATGGCRGRRLGLAGGGLLWHSCGLRNIARSGTPGGALNMTLASANARSVSVASGAQRCRPRWAVQAARALRSVTAPMQREAGGG
jgi:hypothetical protein